MAPSKITKKRQSSSKGQKCPRFKHAEPVPENFDKDLWYLSFNNADSANRSKLQSLVSSATERALAKQNRETGITRAEAKEIYLQKAEKFLQEKANNKEKGKKVKAAHKAVEARAKGGGTEGKALRRSTRLSGV